MLELLPYTFFQNALAGVLLISVAAAIVGTYVVTRRLVALSGGITHACFGGLGLGFYLGVNPIFTAALFAVGASAAVEWLSSAQRLRSDSAIAVVWALGMALGIFFVFITPGYVPELNSFLFGNVLTITHADLLAFAIFTLLLILFIVLFYKYIVACVFDRDFSAVMRLPVKFITYSLTVFTAVCIVLTIRLVGVMLLMSMLTIPQIISEVYCRRFSTIMLSSIVVSIVASVGGLLLSVAIDVPCSALIVMVMTAMYILVRVGATIVRGRRRAVAAAILALLMAGGALTGCSLKKNTAATRNYTAFITRYNVYYNGIEHYKETLKKMEREYADDYSQILFMHPAEAYHNEKAPQPSGDFKRSIEKAQKAIQIRSIKKRPARKSGRSNDPEYKKWLQREEYNPFLHNAWLLLGRSQYMSGDFLGAAATFYYIAKHFWWLPEVVLEAKLWQARSYCAESWLFEAESILNSIKPEKLETHPNLQALYYFDYADLYVKSSDYAAAIPWLEKAIPFASGAQKARLTFLLGQLYQHTGNYEAAYKTFKRVEGMSGASHRTKFNARIRQSEVFRGSDIAGEVKSLRKLTRFSANSEYLDQIYYAIGNLYLAHGDTAQAMSNYATAIAKSTRAGIDKALPQITLGKIYYTLHDYDRAQPLFAEAVPVLPDNYPDYALLKRRSDLLDELAVYSRNVTLQDSLLKLSYLTREQQLEVVDRIIADLKKREQEEADSIKRAEYLAERQADGTGLTNTGQAPPSSFTLNTDRSWYFYNKATREAGRTEFQKRWGSRRLEDNWRRRNKTNYAFSDDTADADLVADSIADDTGDEAPPSGPDANDPHSPEYYLRQIPSTDAERLNANNIIQEGLYNMGIILKDKIDDPEAAEIEFTRLLDRYPDNEYRLDVYYNMYLMYARADQLDKAERYRALILEHFPESTQGQALSDPRFLDNLKRMPAEEQALYERAYAAYLANDNATLHAIYRQVGTDYPMSRIMPKFMFLEALSYVTENNPEKFEQVLSELLNKYPDVDVAPLASSYIKMLNSGYKLNPTSSNLRGMVWATRLGADSTATAYVDTPAEFDFETDGPHSLLIIYPLSTVNANQLLFDVARHNFFTYNTADYDLNQMQFGKIGILRVSGFRNQAQAIAYRSDLERQGAFRIPASAVPLIISDTNFDRMLSEGRTLEEYFEAAGDTRIEQIHNSMIDSSAPAPQDEPSERHETPSDQPDSPDSSDNSDTPEPQQPQPAAVPTPEPTSVPEPEPEYEYDIPIPVVPTGQPAIAPRIK